MPIIRPAANRSVITEQPDGLRITIPGPRRWVVLILLPWLVGWGVGLAVAIRAIVFGHAVHDRFSLLFWPAWLTVWVIGGALALLVVAWNLFGNEIVTIGRGQLAIRRQIAGVGRTNVYDLAQVRDVRVSPPIYRMYGRSRGLLYWGFSGLIAFDYGARTYRFGAGIDEAEAKQIVQVIRERLAA